MEAAKEGKEGRALTDGAEQKEKERRRRNQEQEEDEKGKGE